MLTHTVYVSIDMGYVRLGAKGVERKGDILYRVGVGSTQPCGPESCPHSHPPAQDVYR